MELELARIVGTPRMSALQYDRRVTNTATESQLPDFLSDPLMNLTQRKGRYGVVYLRALAGQAGCTVEETAPGEDVQSIDAKVGFTAGDVFVQVKTTHKQGISGSEFINYAPEDNWLRKWSKLLLPAYFVVVVVPSDSGTWLEHADTGTLMKKTAAFWCRIDVPGIEAANKIAVPRLQRLTASTFREWESDLNAAFSGGA